MRALLQIPFAVVPGDPSGKKTPGGKAPGGDTSGAERRPRLVGLPERTAERAPRRWNLESLAGGITEISDREPAAGLTAAARLIREAQERGEPAAWISAGDSLFYAPDLHDWGVDLAALPVLRVHGALAAARAAECLLRSGAFALVVCDFSQELAGNRGFAPARPAAAVARYAPLPPVIQVRLAALCRRHESALLLLAQKPEETPPIASMAMIRAKGMVYKTGFDRFVFELQTLKDKRQGTGWSHKEELRGPDGLC